MKFELGNLLATPGVIQFCETHRIRLHSLIRRHAAGDWGDLDKDDKNANEWGVLYGQRILSSYKFPAGKVWIITEAKNDDGERSCTTVLLPSEY